MDPVKAQKLCAINSHKQKKFSHQFFRSLIVHSLIAVTCSLLCSFSYLFPSLYTIKHFLFMSLPNAWSGFFNPGCLFIVVNFIVVFLIGESRLRGKQSSPATEMYNEYVERSRGLRRPLSAFDEKKGKVFVPAILNENKDNAKRIEDKEVDDESKEDKHDDDHEEDFEECVGDDEEEEKNEEKDKEKEEEKDEGKEEEDDDDEGQEEEEEAAGIPAEELNKRAEDFISRVNKQRWLEARFFVCR